MSQPIAPLEKHPSQVSPDATSPIRKEAFSAEHLGHHARRLAESFQLRAKHSDDGRFSARFEENARRIIAAHARIATDVQNGAPITRDAEWVLDNFYVVEEQLREIRDDLPRGYYLELPKLVTGEPRVYVLAMELVAHTDSGLDEETLARFIQEFQIVTPLSIGEVWAIPIMLRLVLVENLRRLTDETIHRGDCRAQANQVMETWRAERHLALDLSHPDRCAPLVLEVLEQLIAESPESVGVRELERLLGEHDLYVDQLVRQEHQCQAANQVSIGNVITSMRLISALDWVAFFERVSPVEQLLKQDPAEVYAQMDFPTRDRYRHAVERLAKRGQYNDLDVAKKIVAMAAEVPLANASQWMRRHVGYWLIGPGRKEAERELGYSPSIPERLIGCARQHPDLLYFGVIGSITVALIAIVVAIALTSASPAMVALLALLALLPASDLAVGMTNYLVTNLLAPQLLPKLEFKEGVPLTYPTLVVVPSMLTNAREVQSLLEKLEVHYLANQELAIGFALLTDFADGQTQHTPEDDELVSQAIAGIRALNERYAEEGRRPFYLFHRERKWNPIENTWMGWERKRGKLVEFNRLLHADRETSFVVQEGELTAVIGPTEKPLIQFIITLDADTQLPHHAARKLIGTLAHPLNRPRVDEVTHRIGSGYAVLQPRVSVHLASANQSWYGRLFSNSAGIDPYTTCASDVYQDLFGEGSFTGKGIYDVQAFEHAIANVLPENQILSHDLIEGCHARVGLVSDIELVDSFPSRYDADARRQHRWIRGDWQIAPWLLPRVPSCAGWRPNPLSALSRWKIFDNLRRSVIAPALVLLLIVGWFASPALAWFWTLLGLLVVCFPTLIEALGALRSFRFNAQWYDQLQVSASNLLRSGMQSAVGLAFLPYKAFSAIDAIARTQYRMIVSRRHLLEWQTAAAAEWQLTRFGSPVFMQMGMIAILSVVLAIMLPPASRLAALPILLMWLIAPILLRLLNRRIDYRPEPLGEPERQQLRRYARQTWAFFESYVGAEDHWLPPDNMQEYPDETIAHRISPTNEGLFLTSALVARDFGYIGMHPLIDIWERSLGNWAKLERLNGHFYNWYETTTMQALHPRYVSTVDSGNLAVALLALKQGIEELRETPVLPAALWPGFVDTVDLTEDAFNMLQPRGARLVSDPLDNMLAEIRALRQFETPTPEGLLEWDTRLTEIHGHLPALTQALQKFVESREFPFREAAAKTQCFLGWLDGVYSDLTALYPWLAMLRDLPKNAKGKPLPAWTDASPELAAAWESLVRVLLDATTLNQVKQLHSKTTPWFLILRRLLSRHAEADRVSSVSTWLDALAQSIESSVHAALALDTRFAQIAASMEAMALEMDFRFLFNPQRRLFSIGYNLEEGKLDRAHYDLLCSEARLASHLAIAKGDVEPRHWFQLGRPLTRLTNRLALLSWGGTMFEFMMPPLFQRNYAGSLLDITCRTAVARQEQYGRQHGVPWGISESAFGAIAINSDYHYRSFGVPGLGLKRGLTKDLVVSPYSTFLALETAPGSAARNLEYLAAEGGLGHWGFYDAIDYTPDRVPPGKRSIIVRCHMSHHQGMSLIALGNLMHEGHVRELFHSHPLARSTELLLQEKMPATMPQVQPNADEVAVVELPSTEDELVSRKLVGFETSTPRTHLLSNGQYSVMLTNTGGGYSQCRDLMLTRWRSDVTQDHWGQFIYLRELKSGRVWSAAYQPTRATPDSYEVIYSIDKADFHRRDGEIETHMEVAVSSENNAEVRQLKITNHSDRPREIEVTSFAEVVLNSAEADLAHPAFQKLFIETEYIAEETALLARRRPRDARQEPKWCLHVLAANENVVANVEWESSRQAFLGRCRSAHSPAALDRGAKLSGKVGAVLDPIFSLRCKVLVRPHESTTLAFTTAIAETREQAISLADQYHEPRSVQRAFELAWAFNQVQLRHLQVSPAKAHLFQRLAGSVLYPDQARRGPEAQLLANRQGQPGLWRFGISGDSPIVLVHITKPEQISLAREIVQAQSFWRAHGLRVDLILLNDFPGSYIDALQEQLVSLLNEVHRTPEAGPTNVFVLRGAQLAREDRALLDTAATVVLHGERGSLAQQLDPPPINPVVAKSDGSLKVEPVTKASPVKTVTPLKSVSRASNSKLPTPSAAQSNINANTHTRDIQLEFWNGWGGFTRDGREYRMLLRSGTPTPMPWSNVIANPRFGTLLTESGGGFTWFENSRENKLTTWSNDPVGDTPAEMLYIQDESTGQLWSPLRNLGEGSERWVHHGQGYTTYVQDSHGLSQEVTISVAAEDPIKFIRVQLTNQQASAKSLSLTYFVEWVLGVNREQTQLHIVTSQDPQSGALLARNAYHSEFGGQVAFLQTLGTHTVCGDRREFIGRNGDLAAPDAIRQGKLSGRVGAGFDPCGAVETSLRLQPNETVEVVFLLGSARDQEEAVALLAKYTTVSDVARAHDAAMANWNEVLSTIEFETPDRALNLIANRWLLYQTLSCRFWGRSAFYQAGGAYGFRDQLQDVMALAVSRPDLAREHILRASSRQFEQGDVQHWWHPPSGRGTRTRFSDDLLWLPLVTCHYVQTTGDTSILDEQTHFLTSPLLESHEHERYELPDESSEQASLFEHCRRTIEHGFKLGQHGLPLMGCGDWNDGMNKVGELGQGESVWVGWFLLVLLDRFIPLAEARGESEFVSSYRQRAAALRKSLEEHAWDGNWYRRAYFDDGTPLGSVQNDECQIDSIAQSWAVLAEADPQRTALAMESADERLVRAADKLVLLFAPPFDQTALDPGYIKGYLPGIRENGGQYTHSALWFIQALTKMGLGARSHEIFSLINPIHHAATEAAARQYQIEPYVIAADVYGVPPHTGRGGWSWYTGSAAWMYRVAIENILGFEVHGDRVRFRPCLPPEWPGYRLTLRRRKTTWRFHVVAQSKTSDDQAREYVEIELVESDGVQDIEVHLNTSSLQTIAK